MLVDVTQASLCTVSLTLEWWKGCLLAEVSDVIESCNGLWNNCRGHSQLVVHCEISCLLTLSDISLHPLFSHLLYQLLPSGTLQPNLYC